MLLQKSTNHMCSKLSTNFNNHVLQSETIHGNVKDNEYKYH